MYVHLGDAVLVKAKSIIAILDKDSVNSSQDMEQLIERIRTDNENLTFKSIVITEDDVYCSPLSTGTIKKRISKKTMQELDFSQ